MSTFMASATLNHPAVGGRPSSVTQREERTLTPATRTGRFTSAAYNAHGRSAVALRDNNVLRWAGRSPSLLSSTTGGQHAHPRKRNLEPPAIAMSGERERPLVVLPTVLTVPELCQALRVSEDTVRALVAAGELQRLAYSQHAILVSRSEVLGFLKRQTGAPFRTRSRAQRDPNE